MVSPHYTNFTNDDWKWLEKIKNKKYYGVMAEELNSTICI